MFETEWTMLMPALFLLFSSIMSTCLFDAPLSLGFRPVFTGEEGFIDWCPPSAQFGKLSLIFEGTLCPSTGGNERPLFHSAYIAHPV